MLEAIPSAVGRVLKRARSGTRKLAVNAPFLNGTPETLSVTSTAFGAGGSIPARFTADGDKLSPPLSWRGVPPEARCLVLLVEDADSPSLEPLVHAIVWDLAPGDGELAEGMLRSPDLLDRAHQFHSFGLNSFLQTAYLPPDPPPGHGVHRYAFQLFALDKVLVFSRPPGRRTLLDAIEGHVLARGCLIGTYERN